MGESARERQIERLLSQVPCAECGNPDSPFGSHDCGREPNDRQITRLLGSHLARRHPAIVPVSSAGVHPPLAVSSAGIAPVGCNADWSFSPAHMLAPGDTITHTTRITFS